MANQLEEALDDIIHGRKIKTVFQPIISLRDGDVLGHDYVQKYH
jgi:sensor c-di-GMP phosphodiesterase-like protein